MKFPPLFYGLLPVQAAAVFMGAFKGNVYWDQTGYTWLILVGMISPMAVAGLYAVVFIDETRLQRCGRVLVMAAITFPNMALWSVLGWLAAGKIH